MGKIVLFSGAASGVACVLALACGSAWALALVVIDLRRCLLPDALTLPGAAVVALVAVAAGEPWAMAGGVAWALLYLGVGLLIGGVGGGDVKLALALGTAAAIAAGAAGLAAAVIGSSALTITVMALTRRRALPHGPGMVSATVLVCLVAQVL
ncbi:prepilin peptidase [Corynebacterium frankenforstense]|uniref:prepilin peptidase n=1 Tax=Corynebacterium TaxID=1716 RepID=UPI00254B2DED|nr:MULTISPECIES: prepilin peptidase [Corynebacterium]MDK6260512.1 prepilin peptidase [Corynebacterium frankenforstense]MDK8894771.1 prepilin peptidase [Corynebacterium sp. MSK006]